MVAAGVEPPSTWWERHCRNCAAPSEKRLCGRVDAVEAPHRVDVVAATTSSSPFSAKSVPSQYDALAVSAHLTRRASLASANSGSIGRDVIGFPSSSKHDLRGRARSRRHPIDPAARPMRGPTSIHGLVGTLARFFGVTRRLNIGRLRRALFALRWPSPSPSSLGLQRH